MKKNITNKAVKNFEKSKQIDSRDDEFRENNKQKAFDHSEDILGMIELAKGARREREIKNQISKIKM